MSRIFNRNIWDSIRRMQDMEDRFFVSMNMTLQSMQRSSVDLRNRVEVIEKNAVMFAERDKAQRKTTQVAVVLELTEGELDSLNYYADRDGLSISDAAAKLVRAEL